jgi:hypothetical protein
MNTDRSSPPWQIENHVRSSLSRTQPTNYFLFLPALDPPRRIELTAGKFAL